MKINKSIPAQFITSTSVDVDSLLTFVKPSKTAIRARQSRDIHYSKWPVIFLSLPSLVWASHNKSYRADVLTLMITVTLTPSDWLTSPVLASHWAREMINDGVSSGRLES